VTVGLSTTHAHAVLNTWRGTTYTAVTPYIKLHTADPGAAGTTAASAETTRKALSFAAPSAGSSAATQVTWTAWAAGTETISHFSIWDASTAGNLLATGALASSKAMTNGDTLGVTVTNAITPIAA
jgi:hypothetical protein